MLQLLQGQTTQLTIAQEELRREQAALLTRSQQVAETSINVGHVKPCKPELFEGKRDPATLKRWEHQVKTYMELQGSTCRAAGGSGVDFPDWTDADMVS